MADGFNFLTKLKNLLGKRWNNFVKLVEMKSH